ncbi:MAG: tetratricopeptide repeat protein [Rhodobacter sp.]|nr:tetratricopeptide repeat protein [Rhodobacter sp.]
MALLEKLAVAWSQAGTVWKAAAGCAIFAALVAGVLEDVRHAVFGPVINLADRYFSSPDDQFDACLADHLRNTPRPAPGPFHVFVTVPQGVDGLGQFHLIDQNLRAQFGEDVASVVQVESSDCLILQPASGLAAQMMETAGRRGQAVLSQTGADVVIWGEVKNANKKLRLRFLTKSDAADNTYSLIENADDLLLEPGFGEDVGALIAVKTLTLTTLTVEEQGGFLTPRMELALRITAPLVAEMPAGLDADARGAIQFAHGTALWFLGRADAGTARLEQAVTAYRAALTERRQDRVPLDWAMTQNNLGSALQTLGEREAGTARLEQAVEAYRAALTERRQDRVPLDWAMTQNNLGNALWTLGEREAGTERLEEAEAAYRAALTEWTQDRVPLDWARTQNNLGNALATLGEREAGTARLEQAVAAYRAALTEWTQDRVPLNWAATQMNLGNALYLLGAREAGTARLEQAVEAYRAALTERRQDRVPLDWAMTLGNEGVALLTLADRTGDLGRARQALEQLTLAEATLRSGGHIPWAETFASQIPAARELVDRLSAGPP